MVKIFKFIGNLFLDFIETLVMALSIFVVVYLFFFQPHQVKGNSMYGTFIDGEFLLTNKISYRLGQPQRGDIIIFKAPTNEEYDYIKRIIALPGEKIMIKNNRVYINDQLLDESSYLKTSQNTRTGYFLREGQQLQLEEASFFVMGDNREHSSDSRDWGLVPKQNIVGKAWFRYWPPQKLGLMEKTTYGAPSARPDATSGLADWLRAPLSCNEEKFTFYPAPLENPPVKSMNGG